MSRPCPHEDAVLAAALDSAPVAAGELAAHLASCASCRELHEVAISLRREHAEALAQVRVPSAGQVWWRAEVRARHEDAAAAARPITVATGVAAASLIGALASLLGALAWWLQDWMVVPPGLRVLASSLASASLTAPSGAWVVVWLAAGALFVATPLVLYVALREE